MALTKDPSLTDLAAFCDALSDKTRLHIVFLLAKGECNVGGLIDILKLRQASVSHHLGLLRMIGLVVGKRKAKHVIYALAENVKVSGGKLKISLASATVTVEGL